MKRRKRRSKKKQADHNLSLLGPKFSKKIKKSLQFRLSQVKIVNFLLARLLTGKNIGIVFATSLGKTIIDILFIDAVWQLAEINERPLPKFLILVPTIDLAQQFSNDLEFFRQFQTEDIAILAATSAKRRRAIYNSPAKIIISTPQGIKNDIRQEIIPLNFFQYLILDEAHHSRGKYAYAVIAEIIRPHVRIIAQTATAGQLKKREEIAANLNLEGWYRARIEEELAWLNPIERKEINIPYNEYQHPEWWEIDKNFQALSQRYRTELFNLFDQHFSHLLTARVATSGLTPAAMKNRLKTDPDFSPTVLQPALQIWETLKKSNNYLRFQQMEEIKKYLLNQNGAGISLKMLSLWTSLRQLTEIHRRLFQEGYKSFSAYYHQLAAEQKLSSQRVCSDLIMIMTEIKSMVEAKIRHPKLTELLKILKKHRNEQIIIFLNHVDPLLDLSDKLKQFGYQNSFLIGKKYRHKQTSTEAAEVISDFRQGIIKILLVSPVGFEGRHFPHINVGIAMNIFNSPEQLLQAMGRLGRTKINDQMYFLIFGQSDRAIYYTNLRKIKLLYKDIPLVPEIYTPLDPILETSNLPTKKNDFWAACLTTETRAMVRERFLVHAIQFDWQTIKFILKDKTGFTNARLHIDSDTDPQLIKYYQSLLGQVCIVSGKLKIESLDNLPLPEKIATIEIRPYPDRQNIGLCPKSNIDFEDYL